MSVTKFITLLSAGGLLLGGLVLLNFSQRDYHRGYHEIIYEPAAVIRALTDSLDAGQDSTQLPQRLTIIGTPHPRMRAALDTDLAVLRHNLRALPDSAVVKNYATGTLRIDAQRFNLSALDSALEKALHHEAPQPATVAVPWVYHLSLPRVARGEPGAYPTLRLEGRVDMPVRVRTPQQAFRAHPPFGLWMLLLLAQYGLYPGMLLAVLAMIWEQYRNTRAGFRQMPPHWGIGLRMLINFGVALAATAAAALALHKGLSGERIVTNHLFFSGMDGSFKWLFIIGYALAIACFSGYLAVSDFSQRILADARAVSATAAGVAASPASYAAPLAGLKRYYERLNVMAATVLSLTVLSTGVMFTGINGLPFVQKLAADLGGTPFPQALVFLYAAMHSLLLLLFFLPARLTIAQLEGELGQRGLLPGVASAAATGGLDLVKVLKLLATAAIPIIAPALQKLVEELTK